MSLVAADSPAMQGGSPRGRSTTTGDQGLDAPLLLSDQMASSDWTDPETGPPGLRLRRTKIRSRSQPARLGLRGVPSAVKFKMEIPEEEENAADEDIATINVEEASKAAQPGCICLKQLWFLFTVSFESCIFASTSARLKHSYHPPHRGYFQSGSTAGRWACCSCWL